LRFDVVTARVSGVLSAYKATRPGWCTSLEPRPSIARKMTYADIGVVYEKITLSAAPRIHAVKPVRRTGMYLK